MVEETVIRSSRFIHRLVISTLLLIIVFLMWLGFSSIELTGLLPIGVALVLSPVAAAMIKKPFSLTVNDNGLTIDTPFGGSFFAWQSFEKFGVRRIDPWTTTIAYRLKPEVKNPWIFRASAPRGWHGSLFPYLEIKNSELLQILRRYQYKGRTRLIV